MNKRNKLGFSIVEMIIVIAVIAILALITVFAFNNWRARTAKTEMKYELQNGVSALKTYRNFNNTYPATDADFKAVYKASGEVTLTYTLISAASYCLSAKSSNDATPWYVTNAISQPTTTKPSSCPIP